MTTNKQEMQWYEALELELTQEQVEMLASRVTFTDDEPTLIINEEEKEDDDQSLCKVWSEESQQYVDIDEVCDPLSISSETIQLLEEFERDRKALEAWSIELANLRREYL